MGPSFHECLMLLHLAQKSVSLYYDHSEQFMLTDLKIICHYLFSPLWISTSHPTESLLFPNCYLFMHTFQLQPAGVKIVLFRARSPPALAGGGAGGCMTLCHRSDSWLRQDPDRDGFTTQAEVPISYLTEDQDTTTSTRDSNESSGSLKLDNHREGPN